MNPDNEEESRSGAVEESSRPSPAPPTAPVPDHVGPARDERHDANARSFREWLGKWVEPDGVVATATVLALLFIGWQVLLMRDSNALTRESLTITRRALEIAERPWLILVDVKPASGDNTVLLRPNVATPLLVLLSNKGKSPALRARPFACIGIGERTPTGTDNCPREKEVMAVVAPDEEQWIGVTFGPYSEADLRAWSEKKKFFSVLAGARYSDQFGIEHIGSFCAWLSPKSLNWESCPGYAGPVN